MRDQLRDLISARMHAVDCGCADWTPDDPDHHTPDATDFYRQLADSVMELFPDPQWSVQFADGTVQASSGFTEAGARARAADFTRSGDPAEPVWRHVGPWSSTSTAGDPS